MKRRNLQTLAASLLIGLGSCANDPIASYELNDGKPYTITEITEKGPVDIRKVKISERKEEISYLVYDPIGSSHKDFMEIRREKDRVLFFRKNKTVETVFFCDSNMNLLNSYERGNPIFEPFFRSCDQDFKGYLVRLQVEEVIKSSG